MKEPTNTFLTSIDRLFAAALTSNPKSQLFLGLLMAISREGHLCLSLQKNRIEPRIEGLTPDIEREALEGFSELDPALFDGALVKRGPFIYLKRNALFETQLETLLASLLAQPTTPTTLDPEANLTEEQRHAATKALSQNFFILSGGPGRGKTHTAIQIINSLLRQNPHLKICCAAPTGKAASRLAAGLTHTAIQSGTLHSLLQVRSPKDYFADGITLEADLVLVDECSMIDVRLFVRLLKAIKPGTRLILMGDEDQLPPVEAGTVFSQIVAHIKQHSPSHYAHLTTCLRSDRLEILDFAERINRGDIPGTLAALRALDFQPLSSLTTTQLASHFPDGTHTKRPPQELLQELSTFTILTPLKRGPFGADTLNRDIFKHKCARLHGHHYLPIPIIITQNDRALNLYNGEIGVLLRWIKNTDDPITERDIAYFPDGRALPALLLPKHDLAYALSVHKSQGSEFNEVLLVVPPGSEVFGREVLYTGATRARQKLALCSEESLIQRLIERTSLRVSGLFHPIHDIK